MKYYFYKLLWLLAPFYDYPMRFIYYWMGQGIRTLSGQSAGGLKYAIKAAMIAVAGTRTRLERNANFVLVMNNFGSVLRSDLPESNAIVESLFANKANFDRYYTLLKCKDDDMVLRVMCLLVISGDVSMDDIEPLLDSKHPVYFEISELLGALTTTVLNLELLEQDTSDHTALTYLHHLCDKYGERKRQEIFHG